MSLLMQPTTEAWLVLWAVVATGAAAVLAVQLRVALITSRYLMALVDRDWETVDTMMGISEADKSAFEASEASDGSGVS